MKRMVIAGLLVTGLGLSVGFWLAAQRLSDDLACRVGHTDFCGWVEARRRMEEVMSVDPNQRADAAIAAGDPAFLELNGYASYIPGFDDAHVRGCRSQNLEYTSDVGSEEFHEAQRRLAVYAEAYNRRVAPHVRCER